VEQQQIEQEDTETTKIEWFLKYLATLRHSQVRKRNTSANSKTPAPVLKLKWVDQRKTFHTETCSDHVTEATECRAKSPNTWYIVL